jgi:hypothetical protein
MLGLVVTVLGSSPERAQAQWWLDVPSDGIPRTANGEPNLTAPTPRLRSGRPDLSGIWGPIKTYSTNLTTDLVGDEVPFQPWSRALAAERADGSHSGEDPPAHCLPQGIPRLGGAPAPWKIIQTEDLAVVLYEAFTLWRQIFLDGRRLADDVNPTWLGYSTGHWDGDTLVVDTRGFNGRAWLDQVGKPSTEQLHVVERFTRTDFGHLELEVTIDDPGAYTKPWVVKQHSNLLIGTELLEFICNENNQDVDNLPQGSLDFE